MIKRSIVRSYEEEHSRRRRRMKRRNRRCAIGERCKNGFMGNMKERDNTRVRYIKKKKERQKRAR